MVLIFVGSYLNVPCVIDTVDREGHDFRILSSNPAAIRFFSEFYSPSVVIELPVLFSHLRNLRSLLSDFSRFVMCKRELLGKLKSLHPQKIVFFFVGWNGFECWLINRFSSTATVYYRPKINVAVIQEAKKIRLRVRAAVMHLLFGVPCSPLKLYHYEFLGISREFLKRINAQSYPDIQDCDVVRQIVKERYPKFRKVEVLLLLGAEHNMEMHEYNEKHRAILQRLAAYFPPEEIALKVHPNFTIDDFEMPEEFIRVPDYYPANLFCYNANTVISYASATLFEAANLGKTAISLALLIRSTHPEQAESCKQYLLDNTHLPISFPKSIEEFENELRLVVSEKKNSLFKTKLDTLC